VPYYEIISGRQEEKSMYRIHEPVGQQNQVLRVRATEL